VRNALTLDKLWNFGSSSYIVVSIVIVIAIVIITVSCDTVTRVSISHFCFDHAIFFWDGSACNVCVATWIGLVSSDAMHSSQVVPKSYFRSNRGGTLQVRTPRRPLEHWL
jgi:hypothetical protein